MTVTVNASLDPTRTITLRRQYERALAVRFRRLKGLVLRTLVENDALGLVPGKLGAFAEAGTRFDFSTSPGKVEPFMDWLREAMDDEILEIVQRDGRRVTARREWQNVFVRAAYSRGLEHAAAQLKAMGIDVPDERLAWVFNKPIHADALGLLFTRNFEELRGITEEMSRQIARELAEGMVKGLNPRKIARLINERIDKIGITRARVLARTETIRAHAESTLNRFQSYGIAGVTGEVEFSHAGDDRVCDKCKKLGGRVYTLEEARGVIPVHPNCRCAWLPVVAFSGNAQRRRGLLLYRGAYEREHWWHYRGVAW